MTLCLPTQMDTRRTSHFASPSALRSGPRLPALFGALLAVLVATVTITADAQEAYPERPVKIVVPYPPGGTTDLLARAVAARLTASMKQTFIVDNRGGASGSIGTAAVARSTPDGYTLLMATISTHGINPAIGPVPYDPV